MFYRFNLSRKSATTEHNVIDFSLNQIAHQSSFFHSHPFTELVIPINHCGKILAGQHSYVIKNNIIYIIPPNISHTENPIKESSLFNYYTIKINDTIETKYKSEDNIICLTIPQSEYNDMLSLLRLAEHCLLSSDKNENVAYLEIVCFYDMLIKQLIGGGYIAQTSKNETAPSFIIEAKQYLNENYVEDITVDALAEKYGISRSTFEKKFKITTNQTPKKYLQNVRLDVACHLLITTDLNITQIFALSGFTSAAYFVYAFKEKFGTTPSNYRKDNTINQLPPPLMNTNKIKINNTPTKRHKYKEKINMLFAYIVMSNLHKTTRNFIFIK